MSPHARASRARLYALLTDFSKAFRVVLRGTAALRTVRSYHLFRCIIRDGAEFAARYAEANGALKIWLRRFGGNLS